MNYDKLSRSSPRLRGFVTLLVASGAIAWVVETVRVFDAWARFFGYSSFSVVWVGALPFAFAIGFGVGALIIALSWAFFD